MTALPPARPWLPSKRLVPRGVQAKAAKLHQRAGKRYQRCQIVELPRIGMQNLGPMINLYAITGDQGPICLIPDQDMPRCRVKSIDIQPHAL